MVKLVLIAYRLQYIMKTQKCVKTNKTIMLISLGKTVKLEISLKAKRNNLKKYKKVMMVRKLYRMMED